MIQVSTLRRLLAAADVAKDPYAVAEASAALASANADDFVARLHYVRALMALGLGAVAQRVAATIPPQHLADAVRNQLLATTPGHTPWASRARRFRANAAALLGRYPEYASLLAAWDHAAPRFELHLASDANAFILDTAVNPLWKGFLRGLNDHRAGNQVWNFDKTQNAMPHPVVFDGLGYGWLLPHVLATTANSCLAYSCAVYVVEPDPVALCMLMHIHDLQSVFASDRVRLFLGADALADFRSSFETRRSWTPPAHVLVCPLTRAPLTIQPVCEAILATRAASQQSVKAKIDAYYSDKDAAYWHRRYTEAANGGPPLRVLGLTTRYSTVLKHSMEEMRQAACATGIDMQVAMEPDDASLESSTLEMIASLKPDLLFQISRMRYENPALPANVPFICWDQDNLPCMRTPAATASLDSLTFVAGHGAVFGFGHLNWPAENCIFFHPAGATFRYSAAAAPADLLAQHACDISYVSNASETPAALARRQASRWSQDSALAALFEQCVAKVTADSYAGIVWDLLPLQTFVRATAPTLAETLVHELAMDLKTLADRLFRHAALDWVSRWCIAQGKTFRLYGCGWEGHATLARHAAGPARQGDELRAIYQGSKINLQLTENGFIHSRALDGLAAGGFFLNRHSPADGEEVTSLREIHLLGRWLNQHAISGVADLENLTDPLVKHRWKLARAFHPWDAAHTLRVLKVWGAMPHPAVAFADLAAISFRTEAEFACMAARFLADEPLRRRTAEMMRQTVLEDFSYTARWKTLVAHVGCQLAASRPQLMEV